MSIERQALSGLTWTGGGKLAAQLLSWAVTLLVVRLLVPQDYGLAAISSVIMSILASVAELGLGAALVQASKLERDDLGKVAGLAILLNVAIGILLALCAPLAALFVHDDRLTLIIQVSALQFIPAAFSTVPQAILYRRMDFKRIAWIELASTFVASFATLTLALYGNGVWSLVLGALGGSIVRAALLMKAAWTRPVFELAGTREHLRFGGTLTISRLVWQITSQCDVLIGGRFLSKDALGIYSVSLHLATLPMQRIMSIVNQVAFPTVARMQDDREKLRERLLYAMRLLMFVGVPLTWGIAAIAPELTELVLGPQWHGAIFVLQVMALVIPLKMFSALLATAASAVGEVRLDLKNNITNAIVMPLSFLVGVQWGVEGLAVSWLAAAIIVLVLTLPAMGRVLSVSLRDILRTVTGPAAAGAAMVGAVFWTRELLAPISKMVALPLLIAIGAIAYLLASLIVQKDVVGDLKRLRDAVRG